MVAIAMCCTKKCVNTAYCRRTTDVHKHQSRKAWHDMGNGQDVANGKCGYFVPNANCRSFEILSKG